jgi:hypothetical protein
VRASDIVRVLCVAVAGAVHRARRVMVLSCVDALLRSNRLTLTSLGRSLGGTAGAKHRIKRVDRFLGNPRIQLEIPLWYRALACRLLRRRDLRPIILLDWTHTIGAFNALIAAVPFLGRAIPIYAEVHPAERLANPHVHRAFLAQLGHVLRPGSRPILVADAGFKTPFFDACRDRGWDFVIRLRGTGRLRQRKTRRWLSFAKAFAMAGAEAKWLGRWQPYRGPSYLWTYEVVLGPRPGRQPRRTDAHYQRRAVEPWLLATTLQNEPARQIVALYALRMQIEETFRDTKNTRFGWALELAGSRDEGRQAVLLLIASLALAATLLAGRAVEESGRARLYQANTIRSRRVQSLFHLGLFVLALHDGPAPPLTVILAQRRSLAVFKQRPIQTSLPFPRRSSRN